MRHWKGSMPCCRQCRCPVVYPLQPSPLVVPVQKMQQELVNVECRQHAIAMNACRRARCFCTGQRAEIAARDPGYAERQERPQQACEA